MSTDVAILEPPERSWVALRSPAMELAQYVADTAFVPRGLRGNAPAIAAAILYGDELGLGPMQSLARIAVIDGRPTLASETQRALVLAAGHELWVVESTNTRVTIGGRRHGSDRSSEVTWTLDDAKRAGLAGKPSYRAYPRAMLTARATAELVRTIFADVVGGLAATEELEGDVVLVDGVVEGELEAEGERKTSRRRRKPAAPEPSAPAVEPTAEPAADGEALLAELEGAETGERELAGDPTPGLAETAAAAEAEAVAAGDSTTEASSELAERAAADAEQPALMSDPQRRKMQALFRELDVTAREARLEYAGTVVGRKLASSNELTLEEAGHVIEALEAWKANPDGGPFQRSIPY